MSAGRGAVTGELRFVACDPEEQPASELLAAMRTELIGAYDNASRLDNPPLLPAELRAPAGAYYVLADASRLPGSTAAEKARFLLAATGVASVAGSAFFRTRPDGRKHGDNLLRFCFAKKDDDLDDACARLRKL